MPAGVHVSPAFNRTRIASEGAIPVLVEFMKNSENDIVARQYCAMALGNLAAEPENHMEIVKSDGKTPSSIRLSHACSAV